MSGKTTTGRRAAHRAPRLTGEVEEDLDAHNRTWLDRLTFLADGVFAIAATLLSLDIHEPAGWRTLGELWTGLSPQLGVFAMSYLIIGSFWLAHRRIMSVISKVDPPLTILTLILLALVALVPGLTRLRPNSDALIIYGALVVAIGVSLGAIWAYAGLIRDYVAPSVNRRQRWFQFAAWSLTPAFFLAIVKLTAFPSLVAQTALVAALFLVGWPMRVWLLKRLADKPPAKAAAKPAAPR